MYQVGIFHGVGIFADVKTATDANQVMCLLRSPAETREQRDELLAACKALVEYVKKPHDSLGDFACFSRDVVRQAEEAIAKSERETVNSPAESPARPPG